MEHALSLATWAQEMATIAERKTRAQDKRQNTSHLSQPQAETVWVTGMDQVVRILTKLVQALKHTQRFPDLSVLSYAQSPQGNDDLHASRHPVKRERFAGRECLD